MRIRRAIPTLVLTALLISPAGCRFFGGKPKPAPLPPAPVPTAPPPAPEPEPPELPAPVPSTPKPKPVPPAPVPTPAPAPKPPAFGEILTPQRQAEANRAYEASAKGARQSLERIGGRALTREQLDTVTRIRSFLKQAEEARAKDPGTAAQLARRAEILANDLVLNLP